LAYAGHPSKGLQPAIAVHRRLRERDPRFELHVFGGAGLWGEAPGAALLAPGVIDHGLVGQRKLARQLEACSFSLNLQTRLEPFGMVVTEAMRAGCVVIASPVGAYPELIRHGHDGFLVEGDPREIETQDRAAQLIASLAEAPQTLRQLRAAAAMRPLTWEQVAQAWEGHWDWLLAGRPPPGQSASPCPECGGAPLLLADGLHCPACGRYQLTPAPGSA
jgi:glycosyltransferase involved in cell wall biosynthesis